MPVAVTEKFALKPTTFVKFCGCAAIPGATGGNTVSVANALLVEPAELVMMTEYAPALLDCTFSRVSEAFVAAARTVLVLKYHW